MDDIGRIDEKSIFYRVVVRYRVTLGFLFGILFVPLTLPAKFPFLAEIPKFIIGIGPTRYSLMLGLPFAILGECIRTLSSGVIVKTKELSTEGPYALTRNPLYVGSFIMALGLSVMAGSPLLFLVVAVLYPIVYGGLIRKEEKVLLERYGQAFRDYCARVPRFWPSLANWPPPSASYDLGRMVGKHKEWRAWLALFAAIAYLIFVSGGAACTKGPLP